jgi:hypothetical protein
MLLRNVGFYQPVYTASKPRIASLSSPPWKPEISLNFICLLKCHLTAPYKQTSRAKTAKCCYNMRIRRWPHTIHALENGSGWHLGMYLHASSYSDGMYLEVPNGIRQEWNNLHRCLPARSIRRLWLSDILPFIVKMPETIRHMTDKIMANPLSGVSVRTSVPLWMLDALVQVGTLQTDELPLHVGTIVLEVDELHY